jgi:hypothetical protein
MKQLSGGAIMKKKMKQMVAILTVLILVAFNLVACGREYDSNNKGSATVGTESMEDTGDFLGSDGEGTKNGDVTANRKIIERITLRAETKEFDALMDKLDAEIKKVGGYIESSSVSGNSGDDSVDRYATLTVRVPSNKSEEFTKFVSGNSTITKKEISTEDVTLSYVDLESRVSALETEKMTLERLLSEATSMENVLKIQERLTEVIYEIESVKSQLRTYDSLIDFTTITIHIDEVERVTVVGEQNVWQKIFTNLKRGFENVWTIIVKLFVFLVSSIPYVLVLLILPLGMVVLIAKSIKRKKKRKQVTDSE